MELTDEQKKALKKALDIIEREGLNINLCNDGFIIVDSWESIEKLVQLFNGMDTPRKDGDLRVDANGLALGLDHDYDKLRAPFRVPEGLSDIDTILGEWGFGDEYMSCSICRNHIRTSPDSYSWKADYWINAGEIICGADIRSTKELTEKYLEYLSDNPKDANTVLRDSDLENLGYAKCTCGDKECNFANDFYGHNDDPKSILKKAKAKHPENNYVFDITDVGQFGLNFTTWKKPIEAEA